MKIADLVFEKIEPLFDGEIKLVEVDYIKKQDGMHLIVYIDKENGITIDDCVEVTHMLNEPLDEINPTKDASYSLDVSSYGLDKPLKFDWQFKKYFGKKVNVKLYRKIDDKKEFVATLEAKTEDKVVFSLDEENFEIDMKEIAYITPYIEF
ncbi:MAG: ribosome maturation factor RimP [Clostridiales bacterium]|nr:ribosome maturation factor RimP [Clostridiales bacterium]